MSEMVERVAKALCEAIGDDWNREGVEGLADAYYPLARAAIEAMRNVPEPMRKFHTPSGELIDLSANCNYCGGHEFAWHSLIDEALK